MKKFFYTISALLLFVCNSSFAQQAGNVDTHIAVNDSKNENTFCVIIANENYKHEEKVPFALNDGNIFRLYCEKTLGIPAKNIKYVADATLNDMDFQIEWLERVMKAYAGEASAIVYYSGHGMPGESDKKAYLLPADGYSSRPKSCICTADLYARLGKMPSQRTLVLLDACFSGAKREGGMLASSRGVAIEPKKEPVQGNLVVFSAATGAETAYPYTEKQHGMFTYFLLEQLQQKGGFVTLGELSDYVRKQVGRRSVVENDKSQSPTIVAATGNTAWRNWRFADKAATKYENIASTTPVAPQPIASVTPTPVQVAPQSVDQPTIAAQQPAVPTTPVAPVGRADGGRQFTVNGVSFIMIPVEGGTFQMGSKKAKNEKPVHSVTLSSYYIGQTEVTQAIWKAVMGSNPSKFTGDNLPVERVSWDDCQTFITKLNQLTGETFRLPTEAEWEYAAKGGKKSKGDIHYQQKKSAFFAAKSSNQSKGYTYSGSNEIDDVAWYADNSGGKTHEVATKSPNELGIYDMSGNVYEWCQNWYGDYSSSAQTNPAGPTSGSDRVYRGGGWDSYAAGCRTAYRSFNTPTYTSYFLGLRLAH